MIKLIATDMDGTWLREDKTYDEAMFVRIFDLMQERNIKFVVASGNQHANLLTRFLIMWIRFILSQKMEQ